MVSMAEAGRGSIVNVVPHVPVRARCADVRPLGCRQGRRGRTWSRRCAALPDATRRDDQRLRPRCLHHAGHGGGAELATTGRTRAEGVSPSELSRHEGTDGAAGRRSDEDGRHRVRLLVLAVPPATVSGRHHHAPTGRAFHADATGSPSSLRGSAHAHDSRTEASGPTQLRGRADPPQVVLCARPCPRKPAAAETASAGPPARSGCRCPPRWKRTVPSL